MPSIREWIAWWRQKVASKPAAAWYDGSGGLWQNPLHTPWTFGLYLTPSPLEECEWVHKKVIDKESMEGKWYNYQKGYQPQVCAGGKYAPDSLMGIAVYGGICGRMSDLARGKLGCLGLPGAQVGQPKHSAATMMMPLPPGIRTTLSASIHGANKCLVCAGRNKECTTDEVGAASCSKFVYQAKTQRIELVQQKDYWKLLKDGDAESSANCLELQKKKGKLLLKVSRCNPSKDTQHATQEEQGQLVINSKKGLVRLDVPGGGKMPAADSPWTWNKIQFVQCTKTKCHFDSITDNLDASSPSLFRNVHQESWLAAAEAYNNYERKGLWPVAHDEARLAASLAVTARKAGVEPKRVEEAFAWALQRNPAIYEIWRAAADYPGLADLRQTRDEMSSREWFLGLKEDKDDATRIPETELSRRLLEQEEHDKAHADRFAQRYLLSAQHQGHWSQYPALHQEIIGRFCAAFSEQTLPLLAGQAGVRCRRLRSLVAGHTMQPDWFVSNGTTIEFRDADNQVPDDFDDLLSMLKHVDVGTAQHVVRGLLKRLTVGYVNSRSTTFFGQHRRMLMRGPYAATLAYAGGVLPRKERLLLFSTTRHILENPEDQPERIACASPFLKGSFLQWLVKNRPTLQSASPKGSPMLEADVSFDVRHEMTLDQDARGELPEDVEETLALNELLSRHLKLAQEDIITPQAPDVMKGEERARPRPRNARRLSEDTGKGAGGTAPGLLLQMCVKDVQPHL